MYATRIGAEYRPHKTLGAAVAHLMRKVERTRQDAIAMGRNPPMPGWDILNEETNESIGIDDLMMETTPEIVEAMDEFRRNPRGAGRDSKGRKACGWRLSPEIIEAVAAHAAATGQSQNDAAESLLKLALGSR